MKDIVCAHIWREIPKDSCIWSGAGYVPETKSPPTYKRCHWCSEIWIDLGKPEPRTVIGRIE